MTKLMNLICRNSKIYFKDKGMFITSLITPLILLVLYATFLSQVYKESFSNILLTFFPVPDRIINGLVASQLVSSLLAVCCITVAFCSNMLMVQDKVSGARDDLEMAPVSKYILALGYFVANLITTLIICYGALLICFGYLYYMGWFLSSSDIICLVVDIFLLVLFGCALSSMIHFFLNSQGQISAVGTIISAGYGFLCGAYMPISQFSSGIQKIIMCLPGTYGTSLLRNHALNGVFLELEKMGFPLDGIELMKDGVDCNLYFAGCKVSLSMMYLILIGTICLLMIIYCLMNLYFNKKRK